MESTSPSLQRVILRLVQTHEPIERSHLGLQSRSYDQDNWEGVLDDLISRGLVIEGSVIRIGKNSRRQQKRAVIVYRLAMNTIFNGEPAADYPRFAEMSPEEVHTYVDSFARVNVPSS